MNPTSWHDKVHFIYVSSGYRRGGYPQKKDNGREEVDSTGVVCINDTSRHRAEQVT